MKILIADDDGMVLRTISYMLKKRGYSEVFIAKNGVIALEIIYENDIDLVISDVMMPGISGFSLMGVVGEHLIKKTPFIFISSLNQINLISKSLVFLPYDVIVKPINFNHLFQKIEQLAESIQRKAS